MLFSHPKSQPLPVSLYCYPQIVTAIPTTLSNTSEPSTLSSQRRAIIAGTTVAGVALIFIIVSLIFFCRRRNHRKSRVFSEVQDNPRSRSMLLAEEFDDTNDPHMAYRDYPASVVSDARSPLSGSAATGRGPYSVELPRGGGSAHSHQNANVPPHAGAPANPISPHIMGLRASESGSIFREAVWPPPGEASRFVDPMLSGSSQVDLTRIVNDVMGPSPTEAEIDLASRQSQSPPRMGPALHIRGGSGSSQASLASIPQNPFTTPPPPSAYHPYEPHYRNPSSSSLPGGGSTPPYHTPSHSFDNLGSPNTPPRIGALYVTNGMAGSPVGSPATSPKNWLDRTPKISPDGKRLSAMSVTGSFFPREEGEGGDVGRAV